MRKVIVSLIIVLINLSALAQTNTIYAPGFNKYFRLNGKKLQYDSTRNGAWKNLATESYVAGYVASHGGTSYSAGNGLQLSSSTFSLGGAMSANITYSGAFTWNFGTSGSRLSGFNVYTSGNNNFNATGTNTIQAGSINYITSPSLLLEGTTSFQLTGSAITHVIDTATYKPAVLDASGNLKTGNWTIGALIVSLTDGATISTDASLGYTYGATFSVTLGGNRTIANPTNPTSGQRIIYRITQDATGSRTITWGSAFRWSDDIPLPTLSTTANYVDYIAFEYNAASSKWDVIGINIGVH